MKSITQKAIFQGIFNSIQIEQAHVEIQKNLFSAVKFAKKYLDWDLYECQREWAELAFKYYDRKLFINAPTDHGKSGLFGYVLPLMYICHNRNEQILFATASPNLKKSTTIRIRDQLRYNEKIIKDFGQFYDRNNVWETHRFTVLRPDKNIRDPTFTACTIGQAIEGIRASRGILDDFIDLKAAISETARRNAMIWYNQVYVNRLTPGSPIHMIGTRWHPQDAYQTINDLGTYLVKRYEAINDEWEESSILCTEIWSVKSLRERRKNIGQQAFEQKFRNNPASIIGVRFKEEWLTFYDVIPKIDRKIMTIDPAIGEKTTNDYYARITAGLGYDKKIYVLDVYRNKMDSPSQVRDIKTAFDIWRPERILIEDNAYQRALIQQVKESGLFRVKGITHTSNKMGRIEGMGILFENGTIRIKRDMYDLIHEYINFPGAHDDILDALEMAVNELSRTSRRERWVESGFSGGF